MTTIDDDTRTFHTLRVRNYQPGTKRRAKDGYVSGLLVRHDARTVTLNVERHDNWRGTTTHRDITIDRARIVRAMPELPETPTP